MKERKFWKQDIAKWPIHDLTLGHNKGPWLWASLLGLISRIRSFARNIWSIWGNIPVIEESKEIDYSADELNKILSEISQNLNYKYSIINNPYREEVALFCEKILSFWTIEESDHNDFSKKVETLFTKPDEEEWKNVRAYVLSTIKPIIEKWHISIEEIKRFYWVWRKLKIFNDIISRLRNDTDLFKQDIAFIIKYLKVPKELLFNIVISSVYDSIETNFSFETDSDRKKITREELDAKQITSWEGAIIDVRNKFTLLLTSRLPWDYIEHEVYKPKDEKIKDGKTRVKHESGTTKKGWDNVVAIMWQKLFHWIENAEKHSIKDVDGLKEIQNLFESYIKYAYFFISPIIAKKLLEELWKNPTLTYGGKFSSKNGWYMDTIDKWWTLIWIVEYIDKIIDSLYRKRNIYISNRNNNEAIRLSDTTCWELIIQYQKLKFDIMNWDSILKSLWAIIWIYKSNNLKDEIESILELFENIREEDVKIIRYILRDYQEIIVPKNVKVEKNGAQIPISIQYLINLYVSDKNHTEYAKLLKAIDETVFVWELWVRRSLAHQNKHNTPMIPGFTCSRIKKTTSDNNTEIVSWNIIRIAISPDKKHLAILIAEKNTKGKSYNIHILDITSWLISRSYNWITVSSDTEKNFELQFLENLDSDSVYQIYLDDGINTYLFWGDNSNKEGSKRVFKKSDMIPKWKQDEIKSTSTRISQCGKYMLWVCYVLIDCEIKSEQPWVKKTIPSKKMQAFFCVGSLLDSCIIVSKDNKTITTSYSNQTFVRLTILPSDKSMFLSRQWKYFIVLSEISKIENSSLFVNRIINLNGKIEVEQYELNYSKIWATNIKNIIFSQEENQIIILHSDWSITLFNIENNTIIKQISITEIRDALDRNSNITIEQISFDPKWEFIAIYWLCKRTNHIGFINISTWEIKPLNIKEKIKTRAVSNSNITKRLNNEVSLEYSQKWRIFRLNFSRPIVKSIDISNIFEIITSYKKERDAYTSHSGKDKPNPVKLLYSEKDSSWRENIKISVDLDSMKICIILNWYEKGKFVTDLLVPVIKNILQSREESKNMSSITNFEFWYDWQELMIWTHTGKIMIIPRNDISSLFSIEKEELAQTY